MDPQHKTDSRERPAPCAGYSSIEMDEVKPPVRSVDRFRFDSGPAHQRESANMICAMKKREIRTRGERIPPADIRTCKSSPWEDVDTRGGTASGTAGRVPQSKACMEY